MILGRPEGKNNADRTCSCPRDWRVSAIMGALLRTPPETLPTITALYRIEGVQGGP